MVPPVAVGGTSMFAEHIKSLALDELEVYTMSYNAWRAHEEEWLRARCASSQLAKPAKRARHQSTKLKYSLAVGRRFELWSRAEGESSRSKLKDFLLVLRKYEATPSKADRAWLARCLAAWRSIQGHQPLALASCHSRGGRRAAHRTPEAVLLRRRGQQGSPYK